MLDGRAAAERAARDSYARLLAILAARLRDLAAAEDALAEAFRTALETWPARGVPDRPEAWLMTAAKRAAGASRARAQTAARAAPTLALLADEAEDRMPATFPDHRLGLMFACTHPAVDAGVQVPLMLQVVLGLTAERIAPAFLMTPAALGQRLARAKARLKAAGAAFETPDPDAIAPRLPAVLEAVLGAAALGWEGVPGSDPGRADLAAEALHLAEVLAAVAPMASEAQALLALILHVQARAPARKGRYVPLSEQDPALWDHRMIARADAALARAATLAQTGGLGRFQVEAAIQSVHAARARTGRTDHAALEVLYAALLRLAPSVGAAVAAAAVALERHGPAAALDRIDRIDAPDFQPLWALRAEALARAGDADAARAARTRAIGLAEDPGLRAWLIARAP